MRGLLFKLLCVCSIRTRIFINIILFKYTKAFLIFIMSIFRSFSVCSLDPRVQFTTGEGGFRFSKSPDWLSSSHNLLFNKYLCSLPLG